MLNGVINVYKEKGFTFADMKKMLSTLMTISKDMVTIIM